MEIGSIIEVRGVECRVFAMHEFGTYDVVAIDNSCAYRVSGMSGAAYSRPVSSKATRKPKPSRATRRIL